MFAQGFIPTESLYANLIFKELDHGSEVESEAASEEKSWNMAYLKVQ